MQVFLHLPGLELDAGLRIDHHYLRHGLRERQVNRLPLAQAQVEFVGNLALLVNAGGYALLASQRRDLQ